MDQWVYLFIYDKYLLFRNNTDPVILYVCVLFVVRFDFCVCICVSCLFFF